MKNFLLMFILTTKLFSQENSINIIEEIRDWIDITYASSIFGEKTSKLMFEEEVKAYEWISKYAINLQILAQLKLKYPPKIFGYKLLKEIYQVQLEQEEREKKRIESSSVILPN